MAERHAKNRRLFLRSGIPHAKLVRLMEQLREEGDLEDVLNINRHSLADAWGDVYTRVGRQVKLQVGCKSMDWPIVSFKRALQLLVHSSPHFKQLLAEAFRRQPCSQADPWSVVLYGDEIVPGNVLRPENRRKLMCWYASIKQLGPKCLQHEDLWVPLAVLRSEFVKGETGGFSVATSVLLSETFLHDELATAGVCLDLGVAGGSFATLFFTLGNLIADADGHRAMWSIKGAGGKLPCPCCLNVVNDDELPRGSHQLVSMRCWDASKFRLAQDRDWFSKADMLERRRSTMGKTAFGELETAAGLTYVKHGLLWSPHLRHLLRPTATMTWDAMHVILSNGLANWEIDAVLSKLREEGIDFGDIRKFLSVDWRCCRAHGKLSQNELFSPGRMKSFHKNGELKLGASEVFLVLPLLTFMLQHTIAKSGKMVKEIASFEALAMVVYLIRRGKEGQDVTAELADAIAAHSKAFQEAYLQDPKPKSHYIHHLPAQLSRDGYVIDAFVGERKHIGVKAFGTSTQNTRTYEKTILFQYFAKQIAILDKSVAVSNRLLAPLTAPEDVAVFFDAESVHVGGAVYYEGLQMWRGDVVAIGDIVFMVQCCFSADTYFFLAGEAYDKISQAFLDQLAAF